MSDISIVLLGHQDHGKSTLIGRLLLDTHSIKKSRVEEIKKIDRTAGQKFELAHLIDSFKEERAREMTIDTARAFLKGEKRNYQLIDVPGHAELISNMLTGASNAEAALLIVDAEEGIKEQTLEHLQIAKILGIEQIGVVINKMDKFGYKNEKFKELAEKLRKILDRIGYFSGEVYFFPISAWKGDNVVKRSDKTPWYNGLTLVEFLEERIKEPESLNSLPLNFPVQDKYLERDEEILIGRVESGIMKIGEEILILPENQKSKIKSIKDSEKELKEAKSGENVGIVLRKILGIKRGSIICSLNSNLKIADNLSGEIFWIEKPFQKNLILECGTIQVRGDIQEPEIITQGKKSFYKILLEKPIAFEPKGKTILGKIALKDKGEIIAVGNIK